MKDKALLIEMLIEKVESYAKTNFELYRLKAIAKGSSIFAEITSSIILAVIIVLSFILLSLGVALYLGEILGKTYYGFFALGGLYLVLSIIIAINRKEWLNAKLKNLFITQILKKEQ
jgi:hypothetical protein